MLNRKSNRKSEKLTWKDRRDFLRTLSTGAGVATVALASSAVVAGTAENPVAENNNNTPKGYRETQHICDYYRTAAF